MPRETIITAADVPESKRACPWGEKDCAWLIFHAPAYRPIASAAGTSEKTPMLPRRLEMVSHVKKIAGTSMPPTNHLFRMGACYGARGGNRYVSSG